MGCRRPAWGCAALVIGNCVGRERGGVAKHADTLRLIGSPVAAVDSAVRDGTLGAWVEPVIAGIYAAIGSQEPDG
jgi:hypothetical protein